MKKIIIVLCLALAAGYGLLSYHFILLDDTVKIVKKSNIRYENTFVDARGAKKLKMLLEPDLIEAGINDVLKQVDSSIKSKSN
jgi:hypothetical protein